MKYTWLGQGGFLFEGKECTLMIDPYLSNSLHESAGVQFTRLVPVDTKFLSAHPDVLVLTHNHGDHTDRATLMHLLTGPKSIDVLCPSSVYYDLRNTYADRHNLVLFNRGTEWTSNGTTFKAVKAVHSDPAPIGLVFELDDLCVYVTGDSLYDSSIFREIPRPVDMLCICINGKGNNMNIADALRFTREISPRTVVPVHWGMFERFSTDPDPFIHAFSDGEIVAQKPEFFRTVEI